jgi:hypothetical protein
MRVKIGACFDAPLLNLVQAYAGVNDSRSPTKWHPQQQQQRRRNHSLHDRWGLEHLAAIDNDRPQPWRALLSICDAQQIAPFYSVLDEFAAMRSRRILSSLMEQSRPLRLNRRDCQTGLCLEHLTVHIEMSRKFVQPTQPSRRCPRDEMLDI